MKLRETANKIARLPFKAASLEATRMWCDQLTGGKLDCTQLDILTDLVWKKVKGDEQPR